MADITDQELLELFDQIDTDKSGELSLKEMEGEYQKKGFSSAEIKVCLFLNIFSFYLPD